MTCGSELNLWPPKGGHGTASTNEVCLLLRRAAPSATPQSWRMPRFGTPPENLLMKTLHHLRSRRQFLSEVGRGMVTATIGAELARELALTPLLAEAPEARLQFGALEPLVRLMQETPASRLLPILVGKLRSGTDLKDLVAAGAFANARSFGGEDYVGFHTMMALAPGYHMAQGLPTEQRPLPVFKVLYRNTNRIQESGAATREVLRPVTAAAAPPAQTEAGAWLREAARSKDVARAE